MNGRWFRSGGWAAGLVLVLLLGAGCATSGDDDDDSGDDDAGDDCGSADLLPGQWVSDSLTLQILTSNIYYAVGANQAEYDVSGIWAVDGCTITFNDISGAGACLQSQTGTYSYSVTDSRLRLTLQSDDCAGRAAGMDDTSFTRGS
jgi:hypothetical protein